MLKNLQTFFEGIANIKAILIGIAGGASPILLGIIGFIFAWLIKHFKLKKFDNAINFLDKVGYNLCDMVIKIMLFFVHDKKNIDAVSQMIKKGGNVVDSGWDRRFTEFEKNFN